MEGLAREQGTGDGAYGADPPRAGKTRPDSGSLRMDGSRGCLDKSVVDTEAIRRIIRHKLESGRLPLEIASRVWGSPVVGATCGGCDMSINRGQLAMDGLAQTPGKKISRLHLRCFEIWVQERHSLLRNLRAAGVCRAAAAEA